MTTRIAIIGPGRLGRAFADGLRRAGALVEGPLGRGAVPAAASVIILAVPDREIAGVAKSLPAGAMVGHCAGSVPLDSLAPHERFVLNPLISIRGPETVLAGATAIVAGSSPGALAASCRLAELLGFRPASVAESDRPLVHAAASLTANYLVALLAAAEDMARTAGLDRDALAPLAASAFEAWRTTGPEAALTGPIARGDEITVERQRAAVALRVPELLPLWDRLTEATRLLAAGRKE